MVGPSELDDVNALFPDSSQPSVPEGRIVRVLPDVAGLAKSFDYVVPARWAGTVAFGSMVRVDFHGRRVAGWVVGLDVEPPAGVTLKEISKLSSRGPSEEVFALAKWAAHRYAGSVVAIMKSASPDKMTPSLPAGPRPGATQKAPRSGEGVASEAFENPGVTVVRCSPTTDFFPFVAAVAQLGDSLVITPSVAESRALGGQVRRSGARVSLAGRDWGLGAAGGMVIGARKATWATLRSLAGVLVLDEHDDGLQEERNPTWHARDVAIERARRAGVPCVLVSPCPSVEALAAADRVIDVDRTTMRAGWPLTTVVDRRDSDQQGLFSREFVDLLRETDGRLLCILNRKGRAQMLACGSCGELVRSADGDSLMKEIDGQLVGPGGEFRPLICIRCRGTKLKRLRLGVSRAREELESLAREPVAEVTSDQKFDEVGRARILIGTEALLHRVTSAEAVAFLDFDQDLLAPRYRAGEQAMHLICRAARLVGSRNETPAGRVLIQTRTPEHRVVQAAVRSDTHMLAESVAQIRQTMGFPPFGALAEVSGVGAAEFLNPLQDRDDAEVLGPRSDGKYLVRADNPGALADILADLPRPKVRFRIAVAPPRA